MTRAEEARDKFKYWALIDRCKKVNFPIPIKWMKYGLPPTSNTKLMSIAILSISDKIRELYDSKNMFYDLLRKK